MRCFDMNLDLARQYANSGHAIFPCGFDKKPRTPHGHHDARPDAAAWETTPDALIGLPTTDHWVLDLDAPVATSKTALCAALGVDWAWLEERCHLIVETPGRGLHLYFKRTPGIAIRNTQGDPAPGIDLRGHDDTGLPKGYTIAPGSRMADGRVYRVLRGNLDRLTEAPQELLHFAVFKPRQREQIARDEALARALSAADPTEWLGIFASKRAKLGHHLSAPVLDANNAPGYRGQFQHDLEQEETALAGLTDGRRKFVFEAAARLAKYNKPELATKDEIEAGLLKAWTACGGESDYGADYAVGAIGRALELGANDELPPLARRFRER